MKAKDLILIALICVNVTLASVELAVCLGRSEPAAAASISTRAGDYVLVTGAISSTREALLVIDVVAQRANLYVPEAGATAAGQQFKLASSRNLVNDFSAGARPTR
ncbi:MAG: hypothetical protein AMK72_12310 [Planctomycetes bacterium SM23_25]|nr:MAG: hypothetical protein AMK72_12310 [Planctomycetes bacterium SM23_25]